MKFLKKMFGFSKKEPLQENAELDSNPEETPVNEKPREHLNFKTFVDPRDGQSYKTIELKDGKVWLAQNLNFNTMEGSTFYDFNRENIEKYGLLYTWEAAKEACPPGWHLPTDEEWQKLAESYGGYSDRYERNVGDPNKAFHEFIDGGDSGLDLVYGGGYSAFDKKFFYGGSIGLYWSATEIDVYSAWYYLIRSISDDFIRYDHLQKHIYKSCRCVQD